MARPPGRPPAPNGRKKGKETLVKVLAALAELGPAAVAKDVGVGRELLHAYGSSKRANLPPGPVLEAVADYIDARLVKLRDLTRELRKHAKKAEQDAD